MTTEIVLTDKQKLLLMDVAWTALKRSWVDLLGSEPWEVDVETGIVQEQMEDATVLDELSLIVLDTCDMNAAITEKGFKLVEQDVLKNISF